MPLEKDTTVTSPEIDKERPKGKSWYYSIKIKRKIEISDV
jgi:hypothetical protein